MQFLLTLFPSPTLTSGNYFSSFFRTRLFKISVCISFHKLCPNWPTFCILMFSAPFKHRQDLPFCFYTYFKAQWQATPLFTRPAVSRLVVTEWARISVPGSKQSVAKLLSFSPFILVATNKTHYQKNLTLSLFVSVQKIVKFKKNSRFYSPTKQMLCQAHWRTIQNLTFICSIYVRLVWPFVWPFKPDVWKKETCAL